MLNDTSIQTIQKNYEHISMSINVKKNSIKHKGFQRTLMDYRLIFKRVKNIVNFH